MILCTDIGKDVDDAVALTYAVISGIPISAVVTTSKDSHKAAIICQNLIDNLADRYPAARKIKVMYGSNKPLSMGLNHGVVYDGPFSQSYSLMDPFESYRIRYTGDKGILEYAVVISPLTDLVSILQRVSLDDIIFMGLPKENNGVLLPDMESYNFRCDPFASEQCFNYQKQTPFTFIGKDCAYKVPFTQTDFKTLGSLNHPVAKFLADHAFQTFEHFKTSVPELYNKVYKGTDNMSYCYDPLTMLAITNIELFTFRNVGHHKIATDVDAVKAKSLLLSTIMEGLK
jgi:inosine-uridine nucleoside N-ribohydrolase